MIASEPDEDGQLRDEVKVCDFGIAKISDPATFKTQNQGRALTKTGTLMGTPEYMSPEQARGESLDARSDLYSMGIVLYQMLAGKLPFTGDTILTVVLKQVTDAPVPPSEVRAGVNLALEAVCPARAPQRKERALSDREGDARRHPRGGAHAGFVGQPRPLRSAELAEPRADGCRLRTDGGEPARFPRRGSPRAVDRT